MKENKGDQEDTMTLSEKLYPKQYAAIWAGWEKGHYRASTRDEKLYWLSVMARQTDQKTSI